MTLQGIDDDLALAPPGVGDFGFDRLHERDWAVEGHSGVGVLPPFLGGNGRLTVYGQRLTVNLRVGNFRSGRRGLIKSLPALRCWSVPSLQAIMQRGSCHE
ncbi:hypothetical protein [Acidithrix sp. C25]|uniref:hypothetical protein n=1 Tax=Acidithrix sp. C25 TaxID=1671482 RepID=UPI0020BEFBFE|nr:hypothetical protein [Acidithrix sp. C25]